MAYLHWSPNMSVGIDFMDADHKQLIELLTELLDLVEPSQVRAAVVAKLDDIISSIDADLLLLDEDMQILWVKFSFHPMNVLCWAVAVTVQARSGMWRRVK